MAIPVGFTTDALRRKTEKLRKQTAPTTMDMKPGMATIRKAKVRSAADANIAAKVADASHSMQTNNDFTKGEQVGPKGPLKVKPPNNAAKAAAARVVKMKSGDTLYGIAQREYGDGSKWKRLARQSGLKGADPTKLAVGTKLRITPGKMQKAAAERIAGSAVRGRKGRKGGKSFGQKISYGKEF